ncbi:zf-HC2 domain-containing protein [Panacibacter sp. DH6]|uniref:Zf-HC2 domain-containing protein n=1 Tax=Panacibacter microcysteis TaxID=2793269 RepID=A0A931E5T5_9BACT|nr:hypothetical protein [Panacibacter microcysteis]MBG9375679.1 zf-HC2 domain-containing protein [Panacibacter microcysteis]
MKWKITCKQATILISKKEEGRLSLLQRIQLYQHLWICSLCRLFQKQSGLLAREAASMEAEDAELTPQEKATMVQRITGE